MKSVKIVGTGSYLPGEPITNLQLKEYLGPLGEYYSNLMSIHQRHWAKDPKTGIISEKNSDMATKAALKALHNAKVGADQIDLIVLSTAIPDCLSPPTVTSVQENLSINECFAIELRASCSGIIQALSVATQFIQTGRHNRALVIGSEIYSYVFHINYPENTRQDIFNMFIFGDGAGAAILQASDENDAGIVAYRINSCGAGHKPGMVVPGGLGLVYEDYLAPPRMYQDFSKVKDMEIKMLKRIIKEIPEFTKLKTDQFDKFIFPIDISVLITIVPELRPFYERAFTLADKIGFTGNASLYVMLDDMNKRGLLRRGEDILLISLDGGKWIYSFLHLKW